MRNKAVDVIIAGHSHSYLNTTVNGKLIVEGFSLGTAFDSVNLTIDRRTGDVIKATAEIVPTCNNASITPDKQTAALVAKHDKQVVKMELTGDKIYRLLEQQFEVNRILQISGFNYTYNASNPAGERITSVTINGAPLDRNATCTVAANGFITTCGDGFTVFEKASATQQTLGSDLDALEAYIGSQQQTRVPADFGQKITKQG